MKKLEAIQRLEKVRHVIERLPDDDDFDIFLYFNSIGYNLQYEDEIMVTSNRDDKLLDIAKWFGVNHIGVTEARHSEHHNYPGDKYFYMDNGVKIMQLNSEVAAS